MNPLVEYLELHHNPGGNAIQHTGVDTLLEETKWTPTEIYSMALEARSSNYITMTMKTGYRVNDNDPEGLDIIGLWNDLYRNMRMNRKRMIF